MNGTRHARRAYYYRIWAAFHAFVFIGASRLLNRSMFAGGTDDGFFVQIRDAKQNLNVLAEPTRLLHLARYVAVYPFDWLSSNGYDPTFEAILMVVFLLPVVLVRFKDGFRHPAQPILFYIPLFLSYRTALVACGVGYLFIWIFINNRRNALLAISALLANLSSGAVMVWVGIMVSNSSRRIRFADLARRKKWTTGVVLLAVLGFGYSIRSKLDFFSSAAAGGSSGPATAISRNTLATSITNGQWPRAVFYTLILLAVVRIILASRRLPLTRQAKVFYFFAVPTFLFEGLGPLSYIIPILWFYFYILPGRVPETILAPAHSPASARTREDRNDQTSSTAHGAWGIS